MDRSTKNKAIMFNTLFLYARMILVMAVSLYASRVVLNQLGIVDYGIYNVVGGVVTLLSFLSGAMTSGTQRFLSYEIGVGDADKLNKTFRMILNIHWVIALVVFILAESIGLWFINTGLVLADNRIVAANWVYQCAIVTFIFSIIGIPYNACIVAHEKMKVFAYVGLADAALKLSVAFSIVYLSGDKLIGYSVFSMMAVVIVWFFYRYYCRSNFQEARSPFYWGNDLFYTLSAYTGWNLVGNMAAVCANQGINIVLNIFFGPAVNAARGIALQVNGAVLGFVGNLQMSMNPQIVKSYANSDMDYMQSLVFKGAKYSFYLLYFLTLPIMICTDEIIDMWLGSIPQYSAVFCRLVLIEALIASVSGTLMTAFQATGKIKNYQLIVGGILLLNIPLSYSILSRGGGPELTFFVSISLAAIALLARLLLLRMLLPISILAFCRQVLFRLLLVVLASVIPIFLIPQMFENVFLYVFQVCSLSWIIILLCVWFLGVNEEERGFVKTMIMKKVSG